MPNTNTLREALPKGSATRLCSANSAGRIRNAPSTFGSLKGAMARPSLTQSPLPSKAESQVVTAITEARTQETA